MPSKPVKPSPPADPSTIPAFDRVMRALVRVPKSELESAAGGAQKQKGGKVKQRRPRGT